MGTYREQLLKETYGNKTWRLQGQNEEEPSGFLLLFKLKFTICVFLFAGFAWLSMSGNSFCNVTAEQIVAAVMEDDLYIQLSQLID